MHFLEPLKFNDHKLFFFGGGVEIIFWFILLLAQHLVFIFLTICPPQFQIGLFLSEAHSLQKRTMILHVKWELIASVLILSCLVHCIYAQGRMKDYHIQTMRGFM